MDIRFAAPWSRQLWIMTVIAVAVLVGVAVGALSIPNPQAQRIATGVPLLILLAVLPFMVRGYTWRPAEEALWVHRLGWTRRISLRGLTSAVHDPTALKGTLRLMGNGGLLAFSGWFYNKKLGRFRMFATDLARAVVLRLPDGVVVVTPDDPERLVRELQKQFGAAPAAPAAAAG